VVSQHSIWLLGRVTQVQPSGHEVPFGSPQQKFPGKRQSDVFPEPLLMAQQPA
jgi:hypothetical protein